MTERERGGVGGSMVGEERERVFLQNRGVADLDPGMV